MQLRSRLVDDDKQHVIAENVPDALGGRLNLGLSDAVVVNSVQIDVEDMDAVQLRDALCAEAGRVTVAGAPASLT